MNDKIDWTDFLQEEKKRCPELAEGAGRVKGKR